MMECIKLTLLTLSDLKKTECVDEILSLFESFPILFPKKWAEDDRARSRKPYKREALLAWVSSTWDGNIPMLFGQKSSPYEAFWSMSSNRQNSDWEKLSSFWIDWHTPIDPKYTSVIFDFSSVLANILKPELGSFDLVFENGNNHQLFSPLKDQDLQEYGMPPIGVRTWMGSHIISQIGLERIKSSGGVISETSWGGIQLDLVEQPWLADFDRLVAARTKIMAHLEPSGVFGDYSRYPVPLYSPAPNWIPIPLNQ
jgi:hypothetical protein